MLLRNKLKQIISIKLFQIYKLRKYNYKPSCSTLGQFLYRNNIIPLSEDKRTFQKKLSKPVYQMFIPSFCNIMSGIILANSFMNLINIAKGYCLNAISECLHGYYGSNCDNICGYCASGTMCNKFTGQCSRGCEDSYLGVMCTGIVYFGDESKNELLVDHD